MKLYCDCTNDHVKKDICIDGMNSMIHIAESKDYDIYACPVCLKEIIAGTNIIDDDDTHICPACYRGHNKVKRHWSIFFRERCQICKQKFRREWGWSLHVNLTASPFVSSAEHWYVCKKCAPTRQDAEKVLWGKEHNLFYS